MALSPSDIYQYICTPTTYKEKLPIPQIPTGTSVMGSVKILLTFHDSPEINRSRAEHRKPKPTLFFLPTLFPSLIPK